MNKGNCKRPPRVVFILCALIAIFAFGAVVMLLWNAILPSVFQVGTLTYWQALGILILSKILFGGFGGRHKGYGPSSPGFREKFRRMTDAEKEEFKAEWRRRCGRF